MPQALLISPGDSVATLLGDAAAGEIVRIGARDLRTAQTIPAGHKIALAALAPGAPVTKYGFTIGRATAPVAPGDWVHAHNLATGLSGTCEYAWRPAPPPDLPASPATFQGYVRPDGRAGTRNEIWILPTVGCVARTAQRIAAEAARRFAGAVDGIHAFAHPFGCSQLGEDLAGTRAILAALAQHPNAAGVLLVGLGCESNQLDALIATIAPERRAAIRRLSAQVAADETEEGVALVGELVEAVRTARRETVGLDRLVLGVKCGGSDGFSGLTANPLVGRIADRVVGSGGRVVLTEIPEIFGAEQMLLDRAADRATFDALATAINGFKRYFLDHGEPVSENPSPGNVAGGITTLEEKSLGAVQKAGRAPVMDVLAYGAQVRVAGLSVLEAPGNDAVSSTALAAAGATAILFTTGRGTPLGFPVPTIKIATNSALAARKPGWIDFDAGVVTRGGFAAAETALLDRVMAIASGQETSAERNGEREIAIWKRGVTL